MSNDIKTVNRYHFDTEEAAKTNTMIVGLTSSGKTRLGWAICDLLQSENWDIIIFDPVGVWAQSSMKQCIKLDSSRLNILPVEGSVVYDISGLKIDEQKQLIENFAEAYWEYKNANPATRHTLIVLEEASTFIKYINGSASQNLYRLAMAGRNPPHLTRLMYISPRYTDINTQFRFLAGQKYIGFADEENIFKSIKGLHGKDWAFIMKSLKVGQFLYKHTSKPIELITVPEFKPRTQPVIIDNHKGPRLQELIGLILGAGIVLIVFLPFLILLSL